LNQKCITFQVTLWKKQLLEAMPTFFASSQGKKQKKEEELTDTLYQHSWSAKSGAGLSEKKLDLPVNERKKLVEPTHSSIPISRQCELLVPLSVITNIVLLNSSKKVP